MMPRKPTPTLFRSAQQSTPRQEPLEDRKLYLESLLCIAIRKRVLVTLQFKEYIAERLFEPTIVYLSRRNQLCVAGIQITDLETPLNNLQARSFEIGEIRNVILTEKTFVIDPVVDRFDGKYANGIICSTY